MLQGQQKIVSPYQYHINNASEIALGDSFRPSISQEKKICLTYGPFSQEENSLRVKTESIGPVLSRYASEIEESRCKNCQLWKNWASVHQREMLELQKQLIQREQKLVEVMQKQKEELIQNKSIIMQLQFQLDKSKEKIQMLQAQIRKINKNIDELAIKQTICQTPRKLQRSQKNISNQQKEQMVISEGFNSLDKTEKYNSLIKTSVITTKTEGWGCEQTLKKQKLLINLPTKRTDIDRFLFQNQALRDYNSTLMDRLASTRFKKSIY